MPQLPLHDPKALESAKPEAIKHYRDLIEALPIKCSNGAIFDADTRSEQHIKNVIAHWDALSVTSIEWKLADNSDVVFNKEELEQCLVEIREKRVLRVTRVHKEYQTYKSNVNTTLRDLENWKQTYEVV
jgi:hypothetical protein